MRVVEQKLLGEEKENGSQDQYRSGWEEQILLFNKLSEEAWQNIQEQAIAAIIHHRQGSSRHKPALFPAVTLRIQHYGDPSDGSYE